MRVIIIQPDCRSYRTDLFKGLSSKVNLTLAHNGIFKFQGYNKIKEIRLEVITFKGFHFIKNLFKICKDFDAIIVVYDLHWINAFFLSLRFKEKIIYWGHGPGKNKFIFPLRRLTSKKAKSLILYSNEGKEKFIKLGIDKEKIFVAHNTLKIPNSSNTSKNNKKYFIFLGRLQVRKRLDLFLQAYKKLPLKTKISIVIIGDGEYVKNKLIDQAEKLNIKERVIFLNGTTNHSKIKSYFEKSYAYVSPGAVGLGVLHSFAYGVPVITMPDIQHGPEFSNLIDKENGYLAKTQEELILALSQVIDNVEYLGTNAFNHYREKRSVENMVTSFKNAIDFT